MNTVSCNGEHRLVFVREYDKVKITSGTNAYNYAETVNELQIGHSRLIRYAFEVADAIGIKEVSTVLAEKIFWHERAMLKRRATLILSDKLTQAKGVTLTDIDNLPDV